MTSASHNLLVLSDVHLGSDLLDHVRPGLSRHSASDNRDRELASLLDWYRTHRKGDRPWRLVIAGDFVDFVGMSVKVPDARFGTAPDRDDVEHGLGSAEEHTVHKLRCVARRHEPVFESLSRFVSDGNTLVVLRGNHDIDFHWPAVQDEFVRQLASHGSFERGQVEFAHWFYYEEGRVYVEHGHQYDRYCSYEHVLYPVSPRDPRRSSRSLSDVLLRNVVRPTRGLGESGHESSSAASYIVFAARLGLLGMVMLAHRFARAVGTLFGIWREQFTESARRIREHHERKMAELAAMLDIRLESLRELASLQRPPVTRSFTRLSLTVMLDRILLGTFGVLAVLLTYAFGFGWSRVLEIAVVFTGLTLGTSILVSLLRRDIEPSRELRERAANVVRLFPAAFVVMGHTHLPEMGPNGGAQSTYVNLGAWSEGAGEGSSSTQTHLVVHEQDDGQPVAELLVWDTATGPRRFVSAADLGRPGRERDEQR